MATRVKHQELVDYMNKALELETDKCIEWPYAKSHGYGVIRIADKNYKLSRLALIKRVGEPPADKPHALHLPEICHNANCFNYRHLRWGNYKENVHDRNKDDTHNKGQRNGQSKLTNEIVLAIKKDDRMQKDIAHDYKLSVATISMIKSGKRWGWLS